MPHAWNASKSYQSQPSIESASYLQDPVQEIPNQFRQLQCLHRQLNHAAGAAKPVNLYLCRG
jgi:hypothetical protein